jgi:hypothetical protein
MGRLPALLVSQLSHHDPTVPLSPLSRTTTRTMAPGEAAFVRCNGWSPPNDCQILVVTGVEWGVTMFSHEPPQDPEDDQPTEVTYARGRLPDRTYISRTFPLDLRASQDFGQPARWVTKVFDESPDRNPLGESPSTWEWTEKTVHTTPGGRKQVKLMIAREAGQIRELLIQRVPTSVDAAKLEILLKLDRDAAGRLVDLVRLLGHIPVDGDERTVRLDDQTIQDFLRDPDAVLRLYNRVPEQFRELIKNDSSAQDIVAVAHRRDVVMKFRELLSSPEEFESAAKEFGGKKERVWQEFLESNPWILGISLAGPLITSWDQEKLEKAVTGFSVAGPGKRTDGLLRTNGRIRSMVFAEIKHHQTKLLSSEYRAGCWAPSTELAGGVVQIQQTVHEATREIGEFLADQDEDGADLPEGTHLARPRSFLIVGHLDQLRGPAGGVHRAKYRSFELYRRNLHEPEIITFDELLARAEWYVGSTDKL